MDDIAAPHSDDLPLLEVAEEVLLADLPVVLAIIVPVLQGDKLNWLVVDVRGEAFLRHGVETLRMQVLRPSRVVLRILDQVFFRGFAAILFAVVDQRNQVVRVARVPRDQVDEESRVLWLLQVEVDHGIQVSHS